MTGILQERYARDILRKTRSPGAVIMGNFESTKILRGCGFFYSKSIHCHLIFEHSEWVYLRTADDKQYESNNKKIEGESL